MKKNIRSGFYDDGEVHGTENWKGKDNNWYGVPGIRMIWHGEWADPELECDGYVANYYDVENYLYENAKDDGIDVENDDAFAEYVREHADDAKWMISEYGEKQIDSGCHNKKKKGKKPVKSSKTVTYEGIPEYAVNYLCYHDMDGLTDEDVENIEKWQQKEGVGDLVSIEDEDPYFRDRPEFGLATTCVTGTFWVNSSRKPVKSGRVTKDMWDEHLTELAIPKKDKIKYGLEEDDFFDEYSPSPETPPFELQEELEEGDDTVPFFNDVDERDDYYYSHVKSSRRPVKSAMDNTAWYHREPKRLGKWQVVYMEDGKEKYQFNLNSKEDCIDWINDNGFTLDTSMIESAMPGKEKGIQAIMDEYGCTREEAEEIMNESIESSKKPIKSSLSESFDNDVLFLVVDINGLSSYAGAESEFTKGEILTYDELFWNIKNGSDSINGYCDADLIEGNAFGPGSVEADVRLTFMGMNPSEDEEDDDYIEDCEIKLRIIPSYQYAVKIINGLNEDIMNS